MIKVVIYFIRSIFQEMQHPLPIGRTEFEAWSTRVITGAAVPGLTQDSANLALTSALLHLPSTQSFCSDSFFTHSLRKAAVNQTAYTIMQELDQKQKARQAAAIAEAAKATPPVAGATSAPTLTAVPNLPEAPAAAPKP